MKRYSIGSEDDRYVYRHEVVAEDEPEARVIFNRAYPGHRVYDMYEYPSRHPEISLISMIPREQ